MLHNTVIHHVHKHANVPQSLDVLVCLCGAFGHQIVMVNTDYNAENGWLARMDMEAMEVVPSRTFYYLLKQLLTNMC